jgi:hypothetical protein
MAETWECTACWLVFHWVSFHLDIESRIDKQDFSGNWHQLPPPKPLLAIVRNIHLQTERNETTRMDREDALVDGCVIRRKLRRETSKKRQEKNAAEFRPILNRKGSKGAELLKYYLAFLLLLSLILCKSTKNYNLSEHVDTDNKIFINPNAFKNSNLVGDRIYFSAAEFFGEPAGNFCHALATLQSPDAGRVGAEGRQLGLLGEQALGAVNGLLARGYGGHQRTLGFREYAPHLGILRLRQTHTVHTCVHVHLHRNRKWHKCFKAIQKR